MQRDGDVDLTRTTLEFLAGSGVSPAPLDAAGALSGMGPVIAWATPHGTHLEFFDSIGGHSRFRLDLPSGGGGPAGVLSEIAEALEALGLQHLAQTPVEIESAAATGGATATSGLILGSARIRIGGTDDDPVILDLASLTNHSATFSASGPNGAKFSAAWVASEPGDESGFGRILLQRFDLAAEGSEPVKIWRAGAAEEPRSGAVKLAPGPTNDNVVWVGAQDGGPIGGVYGREPKVAVLQDGDTLVTWMGPDGHVHGRYYAGDTLEGASLDEAQVQSLNELLADLGPAAQAELFEERQRTRLSTLGDQAIALLWVAGLAGALELRGKVFLVESTGEDAHWAAADVQPILLPAGFTGEFDLGPAAEGDGLVTYSVATEAGGRSFAVLLDIATARIGDADAEGGRPGAQGIGATSLPVEVAAAQPPPADVQEYALAVDAAASSQKEGGAVHYHAVLRGELFADDDGVAGFSAGDTIRASDDALHGTDDNEILLGDVANMLGIGGDDSLLGEGGDDLAFGGAGDDTIDGGEGDGDIAAYLGNAAHYAIMLRGDGSFVVLDAGFDDGAGVADRDAQGNVNVDGVDSVSGVEAFLFLDGNIDFINELLTGADSGRALPGLTLSAADLYQLKSQDERLTGNSDDDAAGIESAPTPVTWGLDSETAAHGQTVGETATNGEIEYAPAVIAQPNGFLVAWQAPAEAGKSTLSIAAYDQLARPAGETEVLTNQADAGTAAAIASGGEGLVAAWVETAPAGTTAVKTSYVAHDAMQAAVTTTLVLVPGAEVTELAASGSGDSYAVAWVETEPGATDGSVVVQTYSTGAGDGTAELTATVVVADSGHSVAVEALGAENVAVAMISATSQSIVGSVISQDGGALFDFDLGRLGLLEGGTVLGAPKLLSTSDGEFLVAWQLDLLSGGSDVESALFHKDEAGGWQLPLQKTLLRHFEDGEQPEDLSVTLVATATGGAELVVTWTSEDNSGSGSRNKIEGQKFTLDGEQVGDQFKVWANDVGEVAGYDAQATDAGQVVVAVVAAGEESGTSLVVQVLDTRSAADPIVGADGGAGQDTGVGTMFDDIVDGGSEQDGLYGAAGDDVLLGGIGDDGLEGGEGDDELAGGSGSDALAGGAGNDLLMGGHGRDYLAGGDGEDTISYRGEVRDVVVELDKGEVRSSAEASAASITAVYSGIVPGLSVDGDGFLIEDVIGQLIRLEDGGYEFVKTFDIENAEGGLGSDTLRGTKTANKLWGGAGGDLLDGDDGDDLLDGGSGLDVLFGGFGSDTFIFNAGYGNDVIADFGDGEGDDDVLALSSEVFSSFEDVFAALAQVDDDVVLTLTSSDTITLRDTDLSVLDGADFRFI